MTEKKKPQGVRPAEALARAWKVEKRKTEKSVGVEA